MSYVIEYEYIHFCDDITIDPTNIYVLVRSKVNAIKNAEEELHTKRK